MKKLRLPDGGWEEVWERDDPYNNDWLYFLDLETGRHICVPNPEGRMGDEDYGMHFSSERSEIESSVERYIEVPIVGHTDHHIIFAEFVRSLTEEVQVLNRPSIKMPDVGPGRRVYSIGGFLNEVEEQFPELDTRDEWHTYRRRALEEIARKWYSSRGFTW